MANKISNIKERVLQITDYKQIAKETFFEKIGMTYGNFKGKAKETPLNSNAIEKILSIAPEINLEWLLTGKGEMTKGEKLPPRLKPTQKESYEVETNRPLLPTDKPFSSPKGLEQLRKEDSYKDRFFNANPSLKALQNNVFTLYTFNENILDKVDDRISEILFGDMFDEKPIYNNYQDFEADKNKKFSQLLPYSERIGELIELCKQMTKVILNMKDIFSEFDDDDQDNFDFIINQN